MFTKSSIVTQKQEKKRTDVDIERHKAVSEIDPLASDSFEIRQMLLSILL